MIIRVLLLALAIFIVLNLVSYLKRQPPAERRRLLWKYSAYGILALAVLLVLTGRMHWIGAAIAALLPALKGLTTAGLRFLPLMSWLRQQRFANPVLNSRFIRIVVNVASGTMQGEVLAGRHQGASLDSLSEQDLQALLQEYQQQDSESARLLAAYMQRRFQQRYGTGQQGQESPGAGAMTRDEALQILGLGKDASDKDIVAAHRKLMQKVHPDRGGSDYLAAKINQAKDFLLNT